MEDGDEAKVQRGMPRVVDQTQEDGKSYSYDYNSLHLKLKTSQICTLQSQTVLTPSASLTEAALLMQSRKSDADVDSICEICPSLTPSQILKLIKSYTPDDCEDSISAAFIDKLTKKLCAVSGLNITIRFYFLKLNLSSIHSTQPENETFTMNENFIQPLSVIFKYSEIKLEDIDIPEVLKLNSLVTKI